MNLVQSKPQVIAFDFDGTLWDSLPVLEQIDTVVHESLQQHAPLLSQSFSVSELAMRRTVFAKQNPQLHHDLTKLRKTWLEQELNSLGLKESIAAVVMEDFLAARSDLDPYPDVWPALRVLRKHFRLVGLTNGNADLERVGLAGFFWRYSSSAELGVSKPSPDFFHRACALWGVSQQDIVHVGDEPERDVHAARLAGCNAVWLNRDGRSWPEKFGHSPVTIAKLTELQKIFTV